MDTLDIQHLLQADPWTRGIFRGVFAYDEIPSHVTSWPAAYVFNTEPSHKEGEHWIAAYLESPDRPADHFDSYGTHPFGKIYDFLQAHASGVYYNHRWIQGPLTQVCGQYCVYFLYFRCLGKPMEEIVNHFDQYDWTKNDRLVHEVVQQLMQADE